MKISVSSYSYSQLGNSDFERIDLAGEMGFEGIEFAEINPGDKDKIEYAKELRAYADKKALRFPIMPSVPISSTETLIRKLNGSRVRLILPKFSV